MPVKATLTNGSFAKEVSAPAELNPASNESEPKPNARKHGTRETEKKLPVVSAGDLCGRRSTTRARSLGPRVAYRRAMARSIQTQTGPTPWKSIGSMRSNLEGHSVMVI